MQNGTNKTFNSLYWKLSTIFLIILVVFAAIALYISVEAASKYSTEVNQQLNRDLAKNTVEVIKPEFRHGTVNEKTIEEIVHSMMVINPSLEVYLLNPEGKILSYVAPEKEVVKLEYVSLKPIHEFLNDKKQNIILGDDPRNPGELKIFSAAEVRENGQLTGYLYIVLASQEYVSAAQMVLGSYILGLSIQTVILILLISAMVGLLAIWIITKKLNSITRVITRFRTGDLHARIPVNHKDELDRIGLVFNEMASTIQKNIEELKGIDNLRRELISNVSHDLRTPIASIQGYAETLLIKKDTLTTSDQQRYLEIIYKSCERLKKQVNELFEFSKLDTNQVKLHPEPFSISELVNDVANKYRILSQKKGVSINTIITHEIPLVKADISLIDRVLQNLIDNAIKFCREGDYINIELNPKSPKQVNIRIADSGEGISQADLPNIFERYYKGSKAHESTGLGLAIVKKIIDMHDSSIEVSSQPGQGTSFIFSLPVARIA